MLTSFYSVVEPLVERLFRENFFLTTNFGEIINKKNKVNQTKIHTAPAKIYIQKI